MAKAPTAAPTGANALQIASSGGALMAGGMADFLAQQAQQSQPKISMNDIIMPRLSILQALSPAVNKRKPEYVEGAEPGKILNVATLELLDSIRVIPAHYIRHHIEWKPNRGGFVADHGEDETIMARVRSRDDKNNDILDNGNIIMPTPTWYCITVDGRQVVIPMPRTQSRTSRSWMSQATNEQIEHPQHGKFTPPLFFRAWDLATTERDDGENSWFVWTVARGPSIVDTKEGSDETLLPPGTMEAAIRFRDLLVSGAVKADASHFEDGQTGGGSRGQDDSAPM